MQKKKKKVDTWQTDLWKPANNFSDSWYLTAKVAANVACVSSWWFNVATASKKKAE